MRLPAYHLLSVTDRRIFESALVYLRDRLTDPKVIKWASLLGPDRFAERLAVQWEVERKQDELPPLFRDAWLMLIACYDSGFIQSDESSVDQIELRERILAGDRSGDLVNRIVRLVMPTLK